MGTLLLNLGQCGNQIAMQLFNVMDRSCIHEGNMYLRRTESCVYHTLLVDTESKILKPIQEDRKQYSFLDPKNILYFQYGRGNNWGLGYMNQKQKQKLNQKTGKQQGANAFRSNTNEISIESYCTENQQILEQAMNQIRREIEKTDYFLSIQYMMSLAGGTGSGLGSRLLEEAKDIFQDVDMNVIAILPNRTGETPLQHYNTLLSVSHLQQYSDSVIYFENDRIYQMLSQIGSKQIDKSVDLSNVNEYIASCILNMLWINDNHTNNKYYQEMISDCCITPGHKFIELMGAPYLLFNKWNLGPLCSWEDLIKSSFDQFQFEKYETEENQLIEQVAKQLSQPSNFKKQNCSLKVISVFRSENVQKTLVDSDSHFKFLEKKIQNTFNPISWNPDAVDLHFIQERCSQKGHDQKMNFTMVNSNKIVPILKGISEIAYQKFRSNAYLHWYWKYGMENQDFEHAFEMVQQIQDNYNYMCEN